MRPTPRDCSSFLLSLLLLAAPSPLLASQEATTTPGPDPPPRIGLALGGGAARGLAHIGFLEWLEEHRVPVHRIAGTSMGGLVGGAYAAGMSTEALREIMREMDWDLVFLSDSPFKYKTFRRKEDARRYPSQIELGLKGGLKFPAGMNTGQEVAFVLDRIGAPYMEMASFDDLPIPFRSVAADLVSQDLVVLDSGSLAQAMRATMAIPGVFTPVAMGERLLVDGGVLNNVPADVARAMGADIVIAVNVGSATDGLEPPENLFEVLSQTMDVMMAAGVDRALDSADVVVTPDLRGLTGADFRRSDELAARGYAAAEAMKARLLPYAVEPEAYESWRQERERRSRALPARVAEVRVEGLDPGRAERVREELESALLDQPFDTDAITRQAQLLRGTDLYAIVRYGLQAGESAPTPDAPGTEEAAALVFTAQPKDYGPPFLHPAVDLQNIDSDSFALNLRSRLVFLDTPFPGSEVRIDGVAGTSLLGAAEVFTRLGGTPLFVAPRAYAGRRNVNVFDREDRLLALYREKRVGLGLDIGLDLGHRSQLRLGYDVANLDTRLHVGEPSQPEADGVNRFLSIRYTFDGQTSPVIPTRGLYLRTRATHYLDTPELLSGDTLLEGPTDYNQAEASFSLFRPLAGEHRLFFGASAGTSFGDDPGYNQFSLGGFLRLGAFNNGQIRANNFLLSQAGALIHVLRLPDFLGGNAFIGSWLEVGSAFDRWEERRVEWQASGGLVLETLLGPVFLGGSFSLQTSDGRFYISVGPLFQ